MYRKNDLAVSEWSPENVAMCAVRQKEILENAAKTVKAGGYLLYSTCTYSTEENEEIIADFLASHPSFEPVPCSPDVVSHTADGIDVSDGRFPALALCRRFYPHVSPGEGQFVALLKRDEEDMLDDSAVKDACVPLGKAELAAVSDFLKETIGGSLSGLCLCGGNIAAFPAHESLNFPLPPFGVVSAGVTVGECRKGRIVPHHHFFMAYGGKFAAKCVLEPADDAAAHYLAGEEIAVVSTDSGFAAVLVKLGDTAVTIGGGKLSGGRLKNYYPKGLRVR